VPYAELVRELQTTEGALKSAIHRRTVPCCGAKSQKR
jgi:hypothetical protein